ncbi:polysaccharide pyruvyl transferase family protein [bacterium]|nr:polysaccharide pyruvyl transferase family protein [bacterium]
MYICLTGAKKNIGDFFITDRAIRLLKYSRPDEEFVVIPYWESLDEKLEFVNSSKGIVILGGPGYQPQMYPKIYKLTKTLDDIKVPIIPLGLGWKGYPGDEFTLKHYRFTESSIELLKKMERNNPLSCRDALSEKALQANNIKRTVMTGCPTWYALSKINNDFSPPKKVRTIVFTPPQKEMYYGQSLNILKMLKRVLPDSKIFISFHRGLKTDKFTSKNEAEEISMYIDRIKEISKGFKILDTSYDLKRIDFYDNCDLHIGYRVHAHLNFLSRYAPSFLINEDGRGRGVQDIFNLQNIEGWQYGFLGNTAKAFNSIFMIKVSKKLKNYVIQRKGVEILIENALEKEISNNFSSFKSVKPVILKHFSIMEDFIRSF